MAKRKKEKNSKKIDEDLIKEPYWGLSEDTVHWLFAILAFTSALLFIFADLQKENGGGVERNIYLGLHTLLGYGYLLFPLSLMLAGAGLLGSKRPQFVLRTSVGLSLLLISGVGLVALWQPGGGGLLGSLTAVPLLRLFDVYSAIVILGAFGLTSLLMIFDRVPRLGALKFWGTSSDLEGDETDQSANQPPEMAPLERAENDKRAAAEDAAKSSLATQSRSEPAAKKDTVEGEFVMKKKNSLSSVFVPPPLSLLEKDRGKPGYGDIKANTNIIKRTLMNFGIDVEMDEVSVGPSVTRYALKPAQGVKLARIEALHKDLSLALAAHPLRIEAPIPGRSLVGIEIPNSQKTIVGLASLFSAPEYQNSEKPLLLALGRDVSGNALFGNFAKMPHVLIAGATGSGKSVTIHALVTSLLFRNHPDNLKFLMIDPKRVELTLYNSIPHLLTPVITDPKKAILALKWAGKEMDRRYNLLEQEKVRDIESYHKNIAEPAYAKAAAAKDGGESADLPDRMPYIVVIIDELADIMTTYPRELESGIVRLAQMSRAVGIHLMLSTQRPSVNVITGLIKANIPARIALQVASQIDSRTILDMGGAEKLLGSGDMLYASGEMSKPVRLQSAFISENEVKGVVAYLVKQHRGDIPVNINFSETEKENHGASIFSAVTDDSDDDSDDLYEEAKEIIIRSGKASTTYLQRKLSVGYARAARLMDMLEEKGVIGAGVGSKPREVLMRDENASVAPDHE